MGAAAAIVGVGLGEVVVGETGSQNRTSLHASRLGPDIAGWAVVVVGESGLVVVVAVVATRVGFPVEVSPSVVSVVQVSMFSLSVSLLSFLRPLSLFFPSIALLWIPCSLFLF